VCVVCGKVFIVDPGRGGTPAYVWCRQAEARFSLLQLLLLLLQTSPAAGCLLASAESCCHWQSAPYFCLLYLLKSPKPIPHSQAPLEAILSAPFCSTRVHVLCGVDGYRRGTCRDP
jgi:hypothetical protein